MREGLGWRIHRIWSTDWFANPADELRRALAVIEQAKVVMVPTEVASDVAANVKSLVAAVWAPAQAPTMTRQVTAEAPAADPISKPYALAMPTIRLGNQSLHEVAPATIAR